MINIARINFQCSYIKAQSDFKKKSKIDFA
jgi:hypothetical protein